MIIVYLKTTNQVFKIKNPEGYTAKRIIDCVGVDKFIKIYDYIFPCNDIEHIEVTD